MGLQYSTTVRNAELDAIETAIGVSPVLEIRSGPPPANCAAADTGVLLASQALPSDWMAAASAAAKAKSGTWSVSAVATGYAGHYRIKANGGTPTHIQGIVTETWQASTPYVVGQQVNNDTGKAYKCTTAGTSASSGGPTGTGSGISDGTAVWDYVGTNDMTMDNTKINSGQTVATNTYSIAALNA